MKHLIFFALFCALWFALPTAARAAVIETDVCVFGGTSGGVIAAIQAVKHGKTVSLVVVNGNVGGMTSGGLGATDVGSHGNSYIQGLSRNFYERIAAWYGGSGARFNFEPKVAESIFKTMLSEVGVVPRYNQRLLSVTMAGQRIKEIAMEDGTIYRAKMFVDCTYEGDLIDKAGVSWTVGREAVSTYGESLNGIRASTPAHQFTVPVDPYNVPGDPSSGLLPFIQPGNGGTPGAGDARVQAYNYRMCLTTNPANRLPIPAPPGYDESRYELLRRLIAARRQAGHSLSLSSFMNISGMPNSKTDINNNGAFSTDFIGMSDTYPTATYAEREEIERQHRNYIQGFFYYMGHSQHVPENIRNDALRYGFCADEYVDNGNWSHQIYVREGRRMISDYVMLQQNCQLTRIAADSVGMGAYTMDSHNCQRVVQNGVVRNEGDVQSGTAGAYAISYRSIVPKVGECENLFVPWALSASHIAFGSIRMEPVFMILAQSSATAAAFAIDDGVPVQQVNYDKLALQLVADKQRLYTNSGPSADVGVIVDDASPSGVTVTGNWVQSSATGGFYGPGYLHDENSGKGAKSVRFTPDLPEAGEYDVYLRWPSTGNRATNVPVDVVHATGVSQFTVNQTANGGTWRLLGRRQFNAGSGGSLLIRTDGTGIDSLNGFVIADAARWVLVGTPVADQVVQVVASDANTSEAATDPARLTVVRSGADTSLDLTVNYTVSGTASSGDYTPLTGSVTILGGSISAIIPVQANSDSAAEGSETVTITIQPTAAYAVGSFSSATVRIADRPIDHWRHGKFTPEELLDPQISGDDADPDDDGFTVLEEFPLLLEPLQSESPDLLTPYFADGRLHLSYLLRKAATDVTVTPEGSTDLDEWNVPIEEVSRIDQGEAELITVRLAPSAQGYLRLRVAR